MDSKQPEFSYRDGIDYAAFPPPHPLLKAMTYRYATLLRNEGQLRLGDINAYRKVEENTLGKSDPQEGIAVLLKNANRQLISGGLHTYIFCTSTTQADRSQMLKIDPTYDTIIQVNDPHEFACRIRKATEALGPNYTVECALVTYDKGEADLPPDADDIDLSYIYNFQKDRTFSWQYEFRFTVTDLRLGGGSGHMDLVLGPCKGLIDIIP